MDSEMGGLASRLSVTSAKGRYTTIPETCKREERARQQENLNNAAFWLLGLLNNSGRLA